MQKAPARPKGETIMYRVILDVETAGTFGKSLTYDLGVVVADANGEIVETRNWVISDVYYGMPEKMQTAYYADKLPTYDSEIALGMRKVISMADTYREFAAICKAYRIREVWAYNAQFDRSALNYTVKACSNGFISDFFPAGVTVKCIMGASLCTLCNSRRYAATAARSDAGNLRVSAEEVYRFISGKDNFDEEHTGLADALIETEILFACLRRHQKMDTTPKMVTAFKAWRDLQKRFAL